MDLKKLALLFTFAFVITGIVVYQVRSTRAKSGGVAATGGNPAVPEAAAPAVSPAPLLPAVSIQEVESEALRPETELPLLTIPAGGWGRSPFLTVEEIARLSEPVAAPTPTETVETPKPAPEPLPHYTYHGRYSDTSRGIVTVILNDKHYRVGDRIGKEVVKEIREDSVLLEGDGKTRELSRKTNSGG